MLVKYNSSLLMGTEDPLPICSDVSDMDVRILFTEGTIMSKAISFIEINLDFVVIASRYKNFIVLREGDHVDSVPRLCVGVERGIEGSGLFEGGEK